MRLIHDVVALLTQHKLSSKYATICFSPQIRSVWFHPSRLRSAFQIRYAGFLSFYVRSYNARRNNSTSDRDKGKRVAIWIPRVDVDPWPPRTWNSPLSNGFLFNHLDHVMWHKMAVIRWIKVSPHAMYQATKKIVYIFHPLFSF